MTEKPPRKPGAFKIDPVQTPPETAAKDATPRRPRAVRDLDLVSPSIDIFELDEDELAQLDALEPVSPQRRRLITLRSILFGAISILLSLAIGIWTDDLIRALFSRADWLGWAAFGVALVGLAALTGIVIRETFALRRLASVQHLRMETADAAARDDMIAARKAVAELTKIAATLPATARGRQMLDSISDDIIDGRDLIRLAETEILRPLDREARSLILNASKRVSIVTAVSPRALVDIAYVIFESTRLIRRLSELYGGRPGTLGFLKLTRRVIAHLAVTGTLAMGDSLVHQLIGQGLASRLSAKLGEGVINGLMTARIGISAMDIVRPFPFDAEKRPGISEFIGDLARLNGVKKTQAKD